uniref:Sorting nexin-13 n=1 Tax=Trichobilharzia regenti TaxID=157069 RepID=A0AA85IQK2_TRIRE|nr:unnamed protein product [Trichobilharzia regenti]
MLAFNIVLTITGACILMHHGFTLIFYFFVALVAFFAGFFLVKEPPAVVFRKRGLLFSKGIPKVTAIMDAEGVAKPNTRLSPNQELDDVLNQIVSFIIRDYITPWYNSLTPDNAFPMELHKLLLRVFASVVKRVSEVDWVPFLTETLPSFLATHVRLYRTMLERRITYPDKDAVKLFFDIEAEMEKNVCREEVCSSQDREKDHLRLLSDMFLFFITPVEEYSVPAIRYMARELLVNSVLMPTINLLSDPDFVNRTISWFASENAYTSEYYCHSLRMSESVEEIDVVIRQLNSFMDKLRGHDTGGDDDALIKAQLGSLDYVRKICSIRRRQIQEGIAEKPERVLVYNLQPGARLYDMSFQELMSRSVAVVSFLDFLTSIRKHTLLRLYLNCVSFREGASKLSPASLITTTTTTTAEATSSPVDRNIHPSVLALADASRLQVLPSDVESSMRSLNSTNPSLNNTNTELEQMMYDTPRTSTTTTCDEDDDDADGGDGIDNDNSDGDNNNNNVKSNPLTVSSESGKESLVESSSEGSNKTEDAKKAVIVENVEEVREEEGEEEQQQQQLMDSKKDDGEMDTAIEAVDDETIDDSIEQLRAFGITICSNLLRFMPLSAESLIQRTLRTLTGQPGCLNPNSFVEVEAYIVNILSGPDCFGAFKQSNHYVHLLAELDLLKEPPEQSSLLSSSSLSTTSSEIISQSQSNLASLSEKVPTSKNPNLPHVSSLSQMSASTNSVDDYTNWQSLEMDPSKDVKRQMLLPSLSESSSSSPMNPRNANLNSTDDFYLAEITRTEIMHDSYVIYTVKVNRISQSTGLSESWNTLRRFRHFVELHSFITNRCGRINELKLPSKMAFNNMSPEFLAQRRRGLNIYLKTLCSSEFWANHPASRPLCIQFLQPDSWERGRVQARIVSAILTPFRTVSNAVMSVPDTLADGLNKIFAGKPFQPNIPSGNDDLIKKSGDFELNETIEMALDSPSVKSTESYDMTSGDETPIRILFLLVDEIFDLHREGQFTRQGNFAILRKIFQTFFGIRVNKMIIAKACEWTSAPKITQLVTYLRDYFWPPTKHSTPTVVLSERDKEMKLRTRVLCRTVLLGSVSEELAQFLGNETTRRGVSRVFNMLQEERFNRRFVHTLLEAFLCQLFRPYQAHWEAIYEKDLCPLKSGRPCRSHKACV